MRKLVVVLCVMFSAAAAFAQQQPTAITVFVTNPGFTHTRQSGNQWDGAFGVALQHMFTPRISGEISVSRKTDVSGFTTFDTEGNVVEDRMFVGHSTPVDLTALYHFRTDGAWKPYAGLGVRREDGTVFGDLTGGVVWQFHRALGLRFDGKLLVGGNTRFSDELNGSVGLSWRF